MQLMRLKDYKLNQLLYCKDIFMYVMVNDSNYVPQCIELISEQNVLDPNCAFLTPKQKESAAARSIRILKENLPKNSKGFGELYCHVNSSL